MSVTKDLYQDLDGTRVRTGDRVGEWKDVGTHSADFQSDLHVQGVEIAIRGFLKRHHERVTVAWHVTATRDNHVELVGDANAQITRISVGESGIVTEVDSDSAKAAFGRISRRASMRCVARVQIAWAHTPAEGGSSCPTNDI